MRIIAVSPDSEYVNEANLIVHLLDAGLDRYHLRKPAWSLEQCARLLEMIPQALHSRISIHHCYQLTETFAVAVHLKDNGEEHTAARSRSLHTLASIETLNDRFEYVFLSPIFASLSKKDYSPSWTEIELRAALAAPRKLALFGLGGVTVDTITTAKDFGFDGVVLHGCLWQSSDPLQAFHRIREEAA